MGCDMRYLRYLDERGVFTPDCSILDIGTQNLYLATEEEVLRFWKRYGTPDLAKAARLAHGSRQVGNGFTNEAFLWELLEDTAMSYTSFDIFTGPKTEIFDLNVESLPDRQCGRFDVVLNFGTTEHVINQLNALRVIHDATRVGGFMFHQVPSTGCIDHGYFVYSPKLFHDVAEANGYEVLDLWFSGPQTSHTVFETVHYRSDMLRNPERPYNDVETWDRTLIPNSVVNALLRKTRDAPFRLALDTSTSVGESRVSYAPAPPQQPATWFARVMQGLRLRSAS